MTILVARRLGEEGFVTFAKELRRFGVVNRGELIFLIAFHGAVIRVAQPPLDDGIGLDEKLLEELPAELRGRVE